MNNYQNQYSLEKGSKKHVCPACEKKRFVRYVDLNTREYLPEIYGRCDREVSCAYHLNPYQDGYDSGQIGGERDLSKYSFKKPVKRKRFYISPVVFNHTLKGYEQNTFIHNLLKNVPYPIEGEDIEKVVSLYGLGTICKGGRKGAITFPFIDKRKNVRTIQVKEFDQNNHTTGTDFLHSIIKRHYQKEKKELPKWLINYETNDKKVSCLFGEHLLSKYPYNPIALVEAPKTAVYGSLYFGSPDNAKNFLWLAVYSLSSLTLDRCKALEGREVCLFPDLSKDSKAFELWSNRSKKIAEKVKGLNFKISTLLEDVATDKQKDEGLDLADFLIKQDWRKFRQNVGMFQK